MPKTRKKKNKTIIDYYCNPQWSFLSYNNFKRIFFNIILWNTSSFLYNKLKENKIKVTSSILFKIFLQFTIFVLVILMTYCW